MGNNYIEQRHKTIEQRFWEKVDKKGPIHPILGTMCWVWTASLKKDGYGNIGIAGKTILAHRLSWELSFGSIPDGFQVLHTCDNPPCCNPEHLFLGKPGDNAKDRDEKGRTNNHTKGENNGRAKLTVDQIVEIRRLRSTGLSLRKIASMFHVGNQHICRIVRGERWINLETKNGKTN
jgi:hypothetical protein